MKKANTQTKGKQEPDTAKIDLAPFAHLTPKTAAEMHAYDWRETVFNRVQASRLPPRYCHELAGGKWNCEPQRIVYELCKKRLVSNGAIVALIGPRGVGKTFLAGQLIVWKAWEGFVSPYRKLLGIVSEYKAIYGDMGTINEEEITARRDGFCKRKLVVIDEVHEAMRDNRHALTVLTDILDRRYANGVDTVLISNQKYAEFENSIGDSILSRLAEHGRIIPCEWPSWREIIAQRNTR